MYKIFLTLFFSGVLFAELIDGIAITVKGSPITLYEIKEEMKLTNLSASKAADILIRKKLEELEIQERDIKVSSSEIYEDIKKTASQNNMSISEFYEAVRNSNGLTSTQLKEKIKQKLLSQKLYSSIAYSSVTKPSDAEVEEYYELHKDEFIHPSAFDVVIYASKTRERLEEKVNNPMFYSPDIQTNEQHLPYDKISPELASLLERTPLNTFTPIVPNGQDGFMSFYIKHIESKQQSSVESVKNQIISKIMAGKRERVLAEHFARVKLNADIQKIRMPE